MNFILILFVYFTKIFLSILNSGQKVQKVQKVQETELFNRPQQPPPLSYRNVLLVK